MPSYYDTNKRTSANSASFVIEGDDEKQHFPSEGLYLGELKGGNVEIPALFDLAESKGLCFLYKQEKDRLNANTCLERLVWRIALTVPSNLCDLVLYNGGNPGDAFNAHSRLNKYLFGDRTEKVYFDGNNDKFMKLLNEIYVSIVDRMSTIRCAGKTDLVSLNESLGKDARIKYQFIVLTDFPRHMKTEVALRLAQIIEAGSKAGIYVLMSWDMNADFADSNIEAPINAQQMLSKMELILPQGEKLMFRNSGHDDLFNRFNYVIDSKLMNVEEIEACLQRIDILAETAKKFAKPSILKQDFDSLEKNAYEPVISEINVTVGLDVHDKHPVTFRFNPVDYIHGFILGQSGSGKSVLLNNIITSAILKYSPQDLMLYLMDFKGVEFNKYRGLKHTKAVLVDNKDPQMTLEVVRELLEEDDRRRKLWQKEGVANIDGYNRKYPNNRLPQILFVADECQVMFKVSTNSTERAILKEISDILDVIAAQGRSQGIHMLLATQQLDETNISGKILNNLTECFLLMSAPRDSERLVPDSSDLTSKQMTGLACYYHKLVFQGQTQTFYATDEELLSAIQAAREKSSSLPGNGEYYFDGSEVLYLNAVEKDKIQAMETRYPFAAIGHNVSINSTLTTIPLREDFCENILVFGANKEEQAVGVTVNALVSLIQSSRNCGVFYDVKIIDCYTNPSAKYRRVIENLQKEGFCQIIDRRDSGEVLNQLAAEVRHQTVLPTLLVILGSERFIEMKRNLPLINTKNPAKSSISSGFDVSTGIVNMNFFCDDNGDTSAFTDQIEAEKAKYLVLEEGPDVESVVNTFPEALKLILDEGPTVGVHVISQVDKPANILFEDYPDQIVSMYRHKVILRSENKYLVPMRFSVDIDVETLSVDKETLRGFYYPEDGDPQLFKPYVLSDVVNE